MVKSDRTKLAWRASAHPASQHVASSVFCSQLSMTDGQRQMRRTLANCSTVGNMCSDSSSWGRKATSDEAICSHQDDHGNRIQKVSAHFGLQEARLRCQTWRARLGPIVRVESLAKPSPGQDLSRHGQKRSAAGTSGRPTCVRKRSKSMMALLSTMTSSMVDDDANIVLDLQMPDRLGRSSSHIMPSGPRRTCSDIMTGPTAHRSTVPRSQVGHRSVTPPPPSPQTPLGF